MKLLCTLTPFLILPTIITSKAVSKDEWVERCEKCWCIPPSDQTCPKYSEGYNDNDDILQEAREAYESFDPQGIARTLGESEELCFPFLGAKVGNKTIEDVPLPACPEPVKPKMESVCAFLFEDVMNEKARLDPKLCRERKYGFKTFDTESEAVKKIKDEYLNVVTHTGACGVCSNAKDFSVMLQHGDRMFTQATQCVSLLGNGTKWKVPNNTQTLYKDIQKACKPGMFDDLSEPCGLLWFFKGFVEHELCEDQCGSPNATVPFPVMNNNMGTCEATKCRECVEEATGERYEMFAGRTHKNSGITSQFVEKCEEMSNITHNPCLSGGFMAKGGGIIVGFVGLVVTWLNIV